MRFLSVQMVAVGKACAGLLCFVWKNAFVSQRESFSFSQRNTLFLTGKHFASHRETLCFAQQNAKDTVREILPIMPICVVLAP